MKRFAAALLLLSAKPLCAETVAVSPSGCAKLADYVAGISTTGKTVAPADLDGGYRILAPTDFSLPVHVDLIQNYGFYESELHYGKIPVATVEVKDGRVFLNGKAIENADADLVSKACVSAVKSDFRSIPRR